MNDYDKGYLRGHNEGLLEGIDSILQSIKKLDKNIDKDVLIESLELVKKSTKDILEGIERWAN